jgi:hypothetical protein
MEGPDIAWRHKEADCDPEINSAASHQQQVDQGSVASPPTTVESTVRKSTVQYSYHHQPSGLAH